MSSQRILGVVLLALGLFLLIFGLNASESVTDTVKEGLTGRFTDKTMWYIIGGGVMAVAGAAMTFFGSDRVRSA
ncbi:MAG TPA: DUF3185 family protein [Planctomycetota bacterium]